MRFLFLTTFRYYWHSLLLQTTKNTLPEIYLLDILRVLKQQRKYLDIFLLFLSLRLVNDPSLN